MSRKDTLKAILSRREQELPSGNPEPPEHHSHDGEGDIAPEKKLQHIRSGAVGAMGRSLGHIVNAADHARALIAEGSAVIEISPDKIDGSFISDRLADDGDDYQRLTDAIRDSGQKSPILVRPHPARPDRYQIAFGHRRVRVLAALGRPVKAVVQNLTDEELVVIQGQENSARSDLSYIERGLFALALEGRGFDRRIIMSALGMEKTQLSRLMSVAHALPRPLVEAIGPAPKAGRPRWIALAERLSENEKTTAIDALIGSPGFKTADSDSRFVQVMAALTAQPVKSKPETIKAEDGTKLVSVERGVLKTNLVFDERASPAFADFVMKQLEELHRHYLTGRASGN
jgi:ParB family chromosome partitioning protein